MRFGRTLYALRIDVVVTEEAAPADRQQNVEGLLQVCSGRGGGDEGRLGADRQISRHHQGWRFADIRQMRPECLYMGPFPQRRRDLTEQWLRYVAGARPTH